MAWLPKFAELRVGVDNETNRDYVDLEIKLRMDIFVKEIGQTTKIPGITMEHLNEEGGVLKRLPSIVDRTPSGNIPMLPFAGKGGTIRIRCPKRSKQTSLEIIVATADWIMAPADLLKPIPKPELRPHPDPYNLFRKGRATHVDIEAEYRVMNRPHAASVKMTPVALSQ